MNEHGRPATHTHTHTHTHAGIPRLAQETPTHQAAGETQSAADGVAGRASVIVVVVMVVMMSRLHKHILRLRLARIRRGRRRSRVAEKKTGVSMKAAAAAHVTCT